MQATCRERCPKLIGIKVCNQLCDARPGDRNHFHYIGTSTTMHEWVKA